MTIIVIFDMLLQPFKGTLKVNDLKETSSTEKKNMPRIVKYKHKISAKYLGLNDHLLERDITVLLINYLKFQFIIDALANLPVFIFEVYHGFPADLSYYDEDQ